MILPPKSAPGCIRGCFRRPHPLIFVYPESGLRWRLESLRAVDGRTPDGFRLRGNFASGRDRGVTAGLFRWRLGSPAFSSFWTWKRGRTLHIERSGPRSIVPQARNQRPGLGDLSLSRVPARRPRRSPGRPGAWNCDYGAHSACLPGIPRRKLSHSQRTLSRRGGVRYR